MCISRTRLAYIGTGGNIVNPLQAGCGRVPSASAPISLVERGPNYMGSTKPGLSPYRLGTGRPAPLHVQQSGELVVGLLILKLLGTLELRTDNFIRLRVFSSRASTFFLSATRDAGQFAATGATSRWRARDTMADYQMDMLSSRASVTLTAPR